MSTVELVIEAFRKEILTIIMENILPRTRGVEHSFSTEGLKRGLSIEVEVDNSYLDVQDHTFENRLIEEIVISPDGSVAFVDEEGDEHSGSELGLDELAEIAGVIENSVAL